MPPFPCADYVVGQTFKNKMLKKNLLKSMINNSNHYVRPQRSFHFWESIGDPHCRTIHTNVPWVVLNTEPQHLWRQKQNGSPSPSSHSILYLWLGSLVCTSKESIKWSSSSTSTGCRVVEIIFIIHGKWECMYLSSHFSCTKLLLRITKTKRPTTNPMSRSYPWKNLISTTLVSQHTNYYYYFYFSEKGRWWNSTDVGSKFGITG